MTVVRPFYVVLETLIVCLLCRAFHLLFYSGSSDKNNKIELFYLLPNGCIAKLVWGLPTFMLVSTPHWPSLW